MKKSYAILGLALALLVSLLAHSSPYAQQSGPTQGYQNMGSNPHYTDSREFTEDPYMGWNKGKTWREVMEEYQSAPMMEAVFETIVQTTTYEPSSLDTDATGRAIAMERVKVLIVEDLIDRIAAEGEGAKNISKKVYGRNAGISYELLPDRDALEAILPSLVLVEKTGEDRKNGVFTMRAEAKVAQAKIVPLIIAIMRNENARDEMIDIRRTASDAMGDIHRMQAKSSGSEKGESLRQAYEDAAQKLSVTDLLEKARYYSLNSELQPAVDAYTEALKTSPGLAFAYRNRGGIYLLMEKRGEAASDFVNAYTSDAISHAEARKFDECVAASAAAIDLYSRHAPAYFQRAVCSVGLGRQDNAMSDFKMAARLGEKRAQALLNSKNIEW